MCGRYNLSTGRREIAEAFDLFDDPALAELKPRYNIAPTQDVPIVRARRDGGRRELALVHWGLVPFWADDPSIGNRMINARAEGVADKPSFRAAFLKRRCLVVADGFYEWMKTPDGKRPYQIRMKDDRPFGFAGLWEFWKPKGAEGDIEGLESCTIITGPPNDLVKPIHDRMPVILAPEEYAAWLDPKTDPDEALSMLDAFPADRMRAYPVSTRVNSPANDEPACLEPVEGP